MVFEDLSSQGFELATVQEESRVHARVCEERQLLLRFDLNATDGIRVLAVEMAKALGIKHLL